MLRSAAGFRDEVDVGAGVRNAAERAQVHTADSATLWPVFLWPTSASASLSL